MSALGKDGHLSARSEASPDPPVYPIREDSLLLLPFAHVPPGGSLLEIGCGRGEASVTAARGGARVSATDLNPHAVRWVADRSRVDRLPVLAVRTDLARGLGRFDRVLVNPPYLPLPLSARDPDPWHDLATNGGPDGCRVTSRLIDELPAHLRRGAAAFLVVSSLQSSARLAALRTTWERRTGPVTAVAERSVEGERLSVWELRANR